MRRVKLTVAYDGTDFRGWAAQPGQRTVQGTLTEAVRQTTGEETEIWGASRTDSGAHALAQVCHFDTELPMEIAKWPKVLNKRLPLDLRANRAEEVGEDFHSRFSAESRHYQYRIRLGIDQPFRNRVTHAIGHPLDLERMRRAAERLVGSHDFRAFTEELDDAVENTVRTLYSVHVTQEDDEIAIDIVGTAFLRGMMRRMSGALLEVGRGRRPIEQIDHLLDPNRRDSVQWPVVLPARGLTLVNVHYALPYRPWRTAST